MATLTKAEKLAILESINYVCPKCNKRKPFYDAFEFHHEDGKQKPLCRSCHKKRTAKALEMRRRLNRKEMFVIIEGKKVSLADIRLYHLIVNDIKEHPEFMYRVIAEKYGTTVAYVKNCAHRARLKGRL